MYKLQLVLFAAGLYTLAENQEATCSLYPVMSELLNYDPTYTETKINEIVQQIVNDYPDEPLTLQVFFSAPINVGPNYYQNLVNTYPGTVVNLWGNANVLIQSFSTQMP